MRWTFPLCSLLTLLASLLAVQAAVLRGRLEQLKAAALEPHEFLFKADGNSLGMTLMKLGENDQWAAVKEVVAGSQAEKLGVQVNDLLVKMKMLS